MLARMKPGIPLEHAQADLDVIASNLQRLYPNQNKGKGIASPCHCNGTWSPMFAALC